jgi:hypothetical protein
MAHTTRDDPFAVPPGKWISSLMTMEGPRWVPRPTRPQQGGFIQPTLAASHLPGFSISKRNPGSVGQFHKPPNKFTVTLDDVLRPHRQAPWKLKRAVH